MKKETVGNCPICSEDITIKKMYCEYCDSTIEGNFSMCKFCRLSQKQLDFLEIFIKSRGNLKEVEKELNISYPTIRNKLDDIVTDLNKDSKAKLINKEDIVSKLSSKEINHMEAVDLLK